MAFPNVATINKFHRDARGRDFFGSNQKWQQRNRFYIKHTNLNFTNFANFQVDSNAPPPRTFFEFNCDFIPAGNTELQFNFLKKDGNWMDWNNSALYNNFQGHLHRGVDKWGQSYWLKYKTPTADGFYMNWADGSWKLQRNKLQSVKVIFHAYDNNSCTFAWDVSMINDNNHCRIIGTGWLNIHPKNVNIIKLKLEHNAEFSSFMRLY